MMVRRLICVRRLAVGFDGYLRVPPTSEPGNARDRP